MVCHYSTHHRWFQIKNAAKMSREVYQINNGNAF
ncbi:alpha-glucosidase [Latilactobacillus curvatus]|nr:alpha-glucosidase [Latilactobacillus curvatus]